MSGHEIHGRDAHGCKERYQAIVTLGVALGGRRFDKGGRIADNILHYLYNRAYRTGAKGDAVFRLYSKGCEYAIRALMEVGPAGNDERFQAKKVCDKAGIPESFTRKVFQSLVQGGFLEAARGPGGGYVLSEAPDRISLLQVIEAVDGDDTFAGCILGLPECGSSKPCPLHPVWAEAKGDLLAQLESKTLQDLIDIRTRDVQESEDEA